MTVMNLVEPATVHGGVRADVFDEPARWRAAVAAAVGLSGLELCQALCAGPAFPSALTTALHAIPTRVDGLIIDVGAGTGATAEHVRQVTGARLVTVEPSPGAVDACHRLFPEVSAVLGRADALPIAPGVADAVLLNGVTSLIAELAPVLAEARRVLVPGGVLAITDLVLDVGDVLIAGPNVFRSITRLTRELVAAGFEPIEIGLGSTDPRLDWASPREALDALVAEAFGDDDAYAAFRIDQAHLAGLMRRGMLLGGCIAARSSHRSPR